MVFVDVMDVDVFVCELCEENVLFRCEIEVLWECLVMCEIEFR